MSTPRLPLEMLPNWPRWLTHDQAAAYLGVRPEVFDIEIKRGIWPSGQVRPLGAGEKSSGRMTWDRLALDARSNLASNLR